MLYKKCQQGVVLRETVVLYMIGLAKEWPYIKSSFTQGGIIQEVLLRDDHIQRVVLYERVSYQ